MTSVCRKSGWHPTAKCEDSDVLVARQLRKLNSDLFSPSGAVPPTQNEIMHRNASTSSLLRLPPEIRLRIYKFVFGGRQLWIGQKPSQVLIFHRGEEFFHFDGLLEELDLRPLRICRQIFMESALLPYAFNEFVFQSNGVRRAFEKMARPGKKRVQKKAVGKYEIAEWEEFQARLAEKNGWEFKGSSRRTRNL